MIDETLVDLPVEVFGGYTPAIVPENLPPGSANIAQDVFFPQAGVRTRGGLGSGVIFGGPVEGIPTNGVSIVSNVLQVGIGYIPNPYFLVGVTFAFEDYPDATFLNEEELECTSVQISPPHYPFFPGVVYLNFSFVNPTYSSTETGMISSTGQIPSSASINGLKTYLTPAGSKDLMIWDSLGDMFKEDPQGTLTLINSRPYQNLFYQSQTLFGREYQAFFNSLGGFDIPRQYDDTNWDRVSHSGPGIAPTASDISFALVTISRASSTGVITLTVVAPSTTNFAAGGLCNITGVTADPTLTGQFPIFSAVYSVGTWTLTLWGAFGAYQISAVQRAGGTVTATLEQTVSVPPSTTVIVSGVSDSSYDGEFTTATLSGNQVTWPQTGANSVSAGGFLYVQNVKAPVYSAAPQAYGTAPVNTPGIQLVGNVSGFVLGGSIVVAGNSVSGWNATWPISSQIAPLFVPPGTAGLPPGPLTVQGMTVVYLVTGTSVPGSIGYGGTASASLPASNPAVTGVAGPAGNISQGLHNVSVAYINRQGYISKGAPWSTWYAGGGFQAAIAGIPTGPPNIAQRLLLFTPVISPPAVTGTWYSLPTGTTALSTPTAMLIQDNVTTTAIVDFEDAILISGFQAEYLFNELELGECAAMLPYNARTVWLGERARVPNFLNMGFDGGFTGSLPNGWTGGAGGGGGSALASGFPADWGDAYAITGDGVTANRGIITQSAYQDYLQVSILQPLTSYSVRARLAYTGVAPTQGIVSIRLQSGFTLTAGLQVNATSLTTAYQEFIATFTDAPFASVPPNLQIVVEAAGTLTNGTTVLIDSIEPFPLLTPFNSSTARLSYAFNPEGFDAVTGQVQIRPGDGQNLRAGFPLRNSLYLAKDHYLGYITDDGVNEPSSWTFTEVSATIGICGSNAVDWNEEWAVFAERSGLYICWGSDPVKITPEIQSDATFSGRTSWASINWTAAYTIWVRIDKINRKILIGAPINGAVTPNVVFMLDYRWLDTAEEIAMSPMVTYSAFTGKMLAHGKGRRWAIWNITSNSFTYAERADGSAQPFFGNGIGNGKIYWQQDVAIQPNDDGAVINWQYQTYALPSAMEEQQMQLRAHRKLLGYMKWRAIGPSGYTMGVGITTATRSTILRPYSLSPNPLGDGERPVNIHAERFFLTFYGTGLGAWAQLEKAIACVKKDAVALVRGLSS
jgi:hypothetical protein